MTEQERILKVRNERLEKENKEWRETVDTLLEQIREKDEMYEKTLYDLVGQRDKAFDELEARETAEIIYLKETIKKETTKEVATDIFDAIQGCIKKNEKTEDLENAITKTIRTIEKSYFGKWYH